MKDAFVRAVRTKGRMVETRVAPRCANTRSRGRPLRGGIDMTDVTHSKPCGWCGKPFEPTVFPRKKPDGSYRGMRAIAQWKRTRFCGKPCAAEWKKSQPLPRVPSDVEVAYAAGLFEGEGTISGRPTNRRTEWRVSIIVGMTDREPLEKFMAVWGCGFIGAPRIDPRRPDNSKPMYRYHMSGHAQVRQAASLMYPHLSPRRQAQLDKALERRKG